jgi:small subunit ribosomal protein S6
MADRKNRYELMYVLSGVLKQQQFEDNIRRIANYITDNDGEILETDEWGTQRLAYEIDRKRSGYYVNLYMDAPGTLIAPLERQMEINDDVLRYLILRMDAKMQRQNEQRKKTERRRREEAAEAAEAAGDEEE